ncbi:MAG: hypothetical protein WBP81_34105 [Solirubrobacteraceae bacterium]
MYARVAAEAHRRHGIAAVHVLAGQLVRGPGTGLIAAAQLGVPAAVVKLGLADGVLSASQGAAIIVAALASLGFCAAGAAMAKRAGRLRRSASVKTYARTART